MAINAASRRVLEACGLNYIRTVWLSWEEPIKGSESGDVEYELLRSDYLGGLIPGRPKRRPADP